MKAAPIHFVLIILMLTLAAGCGNPAADAPEAIVEEPAETSAPAPGGSGSGVAYRLADASTIGFVGSKITGSHDGGFRDFDGEIRLVDGMPEGSSIEVVIDTQSLWADNEKLTGHLKSPDFFEVEAHPTARFTSSGIEANGDGTYTITGELDLHGVTKQISFPATIAVDDGKVTANAEFSIKRFDFGIEYKGRADDLIRDDVLIRLNLEAVAVQQA